jgi:hypothetical protein
MKRLLAIALFSVLAVGCGGSDLEPTTDPEAIKREQERLEGPLPGSKAKKSDPRSDAVRREQQRLNNMP